VRQLKAGGKAKRAKKAAGKRGKGFGARACLAAAGSGGSTARAAGAAGLGSRGSLSAPSAAGPSWQQGAARTRAVVQLGGRQQQQQQQQQQQRAWAPAAGLERLQRAAARRPLVRLAGAASSTAHRLAFAM
jgi:hypothetical protein